MICGSENNTVLKELPLMMGAEAHSNAMSPQQQLFCKILHYCVLPVFAPYILIECNSNEQGTKHYIQNIAGLGGAPAFEFHHFAEATAVYVGTDVTVARTKIAFNDILRPRHTANAAVYSKSIVARQWADRVALLRGVNSVAKTLLSLHYSQMINRENLVNRFDTQYYSGFSYICIRTIQFDSWGLSVMPCKKTVFNYGASIITTEHTSSLSWSEMQHREMMLCPKDITDIGVYCENVFMDNIRGGDKLLPEENRADKYAMIIADSFNSFCPDTDSATNNTGFHLLLAGRSNPDDRHQGPDQYLDGAYTCMPTLNPSMGSVYTRARQYSAHVNSRNKNSHQMFLDAKTIPEIDFIYSNLNRNPNKFLNDKLNQPTENRNRLFTPDTGIAFCATYAIGGTSDGSLLGDHRPASSLSLADRLAPRISGTGVFANSNTSAIGKAFYYHFTRVLKVPWRERIQS